ncbi:MAG: hypothetical protein A2Y73_06155 [Chloroflexi bacterium RBG_13_56_8]|nr:MAG: hypothetical protein A2Y73_06155 [Chloroflexi bacterium RBG_13_56_8]
MAEEKIKALLFDLDGTLLINDIDLFMAHYWRALAFAFQSVCEPSLFRGALEAGMRAVWHNDGTDGTNAEVFAAEFFPRVGRQPEELLPIFERFYREDFEVLRQYTEPDPLAPIIMEAIFERGYQVAIATQPMFPRAAILARLKWAEVDAEAFPYDYITCYENMSACKPHPHYFTSLAERLGRAPQECLMIGDSVQSDMAAGVLGFKTFWVVRENPAEPPPEDCDCDAQGTLRDLLALIELEELDDLVVRD